MHLRALFWFHRLSSWHFNSPEIFTAALHRHRCGSFEITTITVINCRCAARFARWKIAVRSSYYEVSALAGTLQREGGEKRAGIACSRKKEVQNNLFHTTAPRWSGWLTRGNCDSIIIDDISLLIILTKAMLCLHPLMCRMYQRWKIILPSVLTKYDFIRELVLAIKNMILT